MLFSAGPSLANGCVAQEPVPQTGLRLRCAGCAACRICAAVVYLTSDVRATTDATGPELPAPSAPTTVPTALTQKWALATDPAVGAVASPYGVVVIGQGNAAIGYDAETGERRWSYDRGSADGDQQLCAIGSGDTDAPGVTVRGKVRGVMVVSSKSGYCSQMMLLDPVTGARHYYRTSPNQAGGALAFGGPYAVGSGHPWSSCGATTWSEPSSTATCPPRRSRTPRTPVAYSPT